VLWGGNFAVALIAAMLFASIRREIAALAQE
jgi:hypothetical protein